MRNQLAAGIDQGESPAGPMPPQAGATSRERFHLFCVTTAAGPRLMMSMSHGVMEAPQPQRKRVRHGWERAGHLAIQ
jgi:hypothetical protein